MSKNIQLTKDPIWTLLRKVTIPASTGSLFQTFYNLVDTWFAGKISADAIAAIAKSFPIYFVIIAVGVGIGAATNAAIGNLIGEKNIRKASLFVAQSVIFAIIISIIVTLFGLNLSNYLLSLMGSNMESILLTREYLDIIFYGTFIVMIQISLNGTLNAQGDTKSYRNVLIFSFFLNIFLNPLFIWGYGIVPGFGIAGLAIATVIAQSIGTLYLIYKVNSCKLKKYIYLRCFIPKFSFLKDLLNQSLPIIFSMLFIGVGIFNILYFIGKFGDLAIAGYGAALRIEQVFLLPVIGLNTAVLSIGGQNFGAKNYNRIRELYTKALIFGSSFMAIAGIIMFIFAETFVSLFTENLIAIEHGAIYLKIAALIGPIYPVFFITTAVFQAVKKPIYSLYLSIIRLTALPFLSLWYVINIKGGSYNDIFYTIMATNWFIAIVVIIFIGYFLDNVFKQKKPLFSY
ncbi:MAG: MATE family efflux transporter [Pelagibacteraceae bacterium BACL5 MAG-120705-bin12]|uniref:MATE family efflux transporter n=1 Tax=Candidatus Pelagibacter sp. TaxID=2024849 RepID=UPI000712EEDB|nr:MAG: MATE family efflux transporter [Pelagibacteraceae bacterium BACL5 MAG-121015-bin10]KRO60006.1 MAG: MATE family efflux transporter [Pelagibacteraceae bacterium BACL5 MAG-121128-bin54]KRO61714.1 MAG: MATE family efflux transporter [Pelagibacteraceae bacterium BACL5 MAG-120705-bin12]KRO65420.1 MAG: MATE family efflux transporter [Pelagibacteraceae bacterium BACL5 MAG-120820-bin39]MDA1166810.1 MATE family efflux transporter [Pseudomonadota bacterium]